MFPSSRGLPCLRLCGRLLGGLLTRREWEITRKILQHQSALCRRDIQSKRCHGVDRLIPVLPAAPASIDNRTYVVTGAAGAHDEVAIGAVRQCDLRGRTDAKCNKCGADN